MAILPQIQERDASEHVHEVYEQVKSRYGGFLPDIYKAFANDPEYLASINDHIAAGVTWPKATKEMADVEEAA